MGYSSFPSRNPEIEAHNYINHSNAKAEGAQDGVYRRLQSADAVFVRRFSSA